MTTLLKRGACAARVYTRARILAALHRAEPPAEIARALSCGVASVYNIKRRYAAGGLASALYDRPRSGKPARLDGTARAKITALACSAAPAGHARWTLRLLADKAVELGFCDRVSHTSVREVLKKTGSSRT